MDDEDDDLYGTTEPTVKPEGTTSNVAFKTQPDLDDDEEEDSDDDIQFTLERPEASKNEPAPKQTTKAPASEETSSQPAKRARTNAPVKEESGNAPFTKESLLHNGKEGKDYPGVKSSSVDPEADPIWPADNKQITELDIDADLAEHSKPWRLPGTDQTDFFNYGFDEYTWTQYCAKQRNMATTIGELKDEDAKMKQMLGGMPGEGAMPDMMQMMQAMMGGGQGMPDPSKMDFSQFSSMMGGMPGMPMPPGGFQGAGNGSPMPVGGQGFQPPSGPAAHQNNMDYGQPDQQGGGRRGRRGRGGYQNF